MRALTILIAAACGAPAATDHAATPLLSLERIEQILDTPMSSAPVLSPDGAYVLYRSSYGGAQLYLRDVAHPEVAPRALVGGEERVGSAAFTRDGHVLYRSDTGADENFRIFRVGLDGNGVVDLTPGSDHWRDHPHLPRDVEGTMIYSQRRTDNYASEIVVQSTLAPTAEPRIVYRDPAPAVVVDVSSDGARALMLREASSGKQLIEVDLTTGTARQLAPAEGEVAMIQAAAYSADGRRAYIARDRGPDAYSLLLVDLASLRAVAEHRPDGAASIATIVPAPTGDRVAVSVDAGDHSNTRILDASTLAPLADVASPVGTVYLGTNTEVAIPMAAGTFSDDGRRFVVVLSAPAVVDDIFVVDAASGAIAPLAPSSTARPEIEGWNTTVPAFDGLPIPVNVYLPSNRRPDQRLPTIVFFHGGPDQNSSLEWSHTLNVLSAAGFALVEPNVRGSSGFGRAWETADDLTRRPDSFRDVESINRWLRAQDWCDPDRLVISGASYGGYLVLITLTREHTLWRAGIDLCGPSDLTTFIASEGGPQRYVGEFGTDADALRELSPLQHAGAIRTPLFVYQGENDARVPRAQSDVIVEALRARGVNVEYMVAANEGHTLARRETRVEYFTRVLAFLRAALEL